MFGGFQLDKAYSRDFMQRGRVRVQLKRDDGTLVNPAIPTRKSVPVKIYILCKNALFSVVMAQSCNITASSLEVHI